MTMNHDMIEAIERMLAIFYALYGLSLLLYPKRWIEALRHIVDGPHPAIRLGLLPLIPAALIIATHNVWELSPRVVVTLIGWLALLKAGFFLLAPDFGARRIRWWLERGERRILVGGVIALIVAGLAAWAGFFMSAVEGGGS